MSTEEIQKRGDRFTFWFILTFLFIQLGIVIPAIHPSATSRAIEDSESQIESLRSEFGTEPLDPNQTADQKQSAIAIRTIRTAEYLNAKILSSPEPIETEKPKEESEGAPSCSDPKESGDSTDFRDKLLDLNSKYIALEKEKRARNFSLPVVGIGIDETVVLLLYPSFVAIGLIGILKLRMDYLRALKMVKPPSSLSPPLWALPIPKRLFSGRYLRWTLLNGLALTGHFLVIYLVVASLFSPRIRTFFQPESAAVYSLLALVTVGFYVATLYSGIREDLR